MYQNKPREPLVIEIEKLSQASLQKLKELNAQSNTEPENPPDDGLQSA